MKAEYIFIALAGLFLFSCSPKVVVQPSEPAVVVPPKVEEQPVPSTAPSPERIAEGKSLYDNHCANCHKLFSPSEFSREDWEPILVRMQKKARLDDLQMASIRDYIHSGLK